MDLAILHYSVPVLALDLLRQLTQLSLSRKTIRPAPVQS